jgi:hypothetical protein
MGTIPENEWLDWAGGECPVYDPCNTVVQVRLRDGDCNKYEAMGYRWDHDPDPEHSPRDIIAYRIVGGVK